MKYENIQYQAAYENACDCLYYGYGKSDWNTCGIKVEKELIEIWDKAHTTLSTGKRY